MQQYSMSMERLNSVIAIRCLTVQSIHRFCATHGYFSTAARGNGMSSCRSEIRTPFTVSPGTLMPDLSFVQNNKLTYIE